MSEEDIILESDKPIKKTRKEITEKQKEARRLNLKKGREKRLKSIAAKKQKKETIEVDVDSSESESDDEVSLEDLVLTKKKPSEKAPKHKANEPSLAEIKEELASMKQEILMMNKLQRKTKHKNKSGTKVVVIPNGPSETRSDKGNDPTMEALLRAIGKR